MSTADQTSAEQKAAPGFAEFRFDDGAYIGIAANAGTVSVIQMQGSTQGRGAAFLTVEQAQQLADAILEAARVAAEQPQQPAPPAIFPVGGAPAAGGLSLDQLLEAVGGVVDARLKAAGVVKAS